MDDELSGEKKGWWNNTAFIVIITIGVVLVLITLALSAALYTLVESVDEPRQYKEYPVLSIHGEIDGSDNTFEAFIISGSPRWNDYRVQAFIGTYNYLYLETFERSSDPGDVVIFTNDDWDPRPGNIIRIRIIYTVDNSEFWDKNISAKY